MAIDPNNYNVIDIRGLTPAFEPARTWLFAIQSPEGEVINNVTLQTIAQIIAGDIPLPDGVIGGLVLSFNNAGSPKTVSVSEGQWRINNVVYQTNTPYGSNIVAAGATDRTDAILADSTGSVYYVSDFDGTLPADTILVSYFIVKSDGSDIEPVTPTPVLYAVMNGLNSGDFDITGQFKINGVPLSDGIQTETFTQEDLVSQGDGFYRLPLPLDLEKAVLGIKVVPEAGDAYLKPIEWDATLGLINFENNSNQTIYVKIG